MSRDNISEQLTAINVPMEVIDKFITAIDECEYERYAPGNEKGNMQKTFDVAMEAISEMEETIKKVKVQKSKNNNILSFLMIVLLALPVHVFSQTKSDVDKLYQKGNYAQAVRGYEKLLEQGESAALYYNLGNCYYRLDNIPHAVLAYERAQRLSPSDDDIRFNLQLAQSKTIDKLTPESEMFFVTWYKALVNLLSVDSWAYLSLISLFLALVSLVVYIFVEKELLQKLSRGTLPLFFVLFILTTFFAIQQVCLLDASNHGIIMLPSAVVRETPDQKSKEIFILHEGSKVKITDQGLSKWTGVQLNDGRQGWVQTSCIEAI